MQRLIPRLLGRAKPQLVLTGSTSGLRSGRPEVAFGASRRRCRALPTLRERFRAQRLAVTCLQLGYLNTEDGLAVARDDASRRGEGTLAPVHDVVAMVRALLSLSDAARAGTGAAGDPRRTLLRPAVQSRPVSIARATRDSARLAAKYSAATAR